ncbi:FUSC family protein [Streptomyces griseoruber]|uniref:FUSC family protein n=1 Tax=Streptomyces griseoruber TaxID=1943 RepID=UPI00378F298D
MLSLWVRLRQGLRRALRLALHCDPGARLLRATALGMTTVLGTYGWSLWIENRAGLYVDSVVQAVVISSAFARVQRVHDRTDRLVACLVLPCAAAGGMELTTLIHHHPDAGDVLFTLGVAASVWIRRFGMRATRAGTLVVLPLVAVLVVPGGVAPAQGHAPTGWAALTALFAVAWGTVVTWVGHRTGLVPRPPSASVAAMPAPDRPGLRASTRMALQSVAALGAAFALGRALWPDHWTWVVLTAFLVGSGARSRGDVLVKGVWRTLGAAAGTVVAGAVAGSFGPHSDTVVVIIFSVLAVATWLRELSYAYWAGCVTAVLSLLYDWFGQDAGSLLHTRLAGIAVGAVLGIAASWLVLPIPTSGTVRSRTAAALAGLGEVLSADPHDTRAVRVTRARFLFRLEQLTLAAAPLRVAESFPVPPALAARWRKGGLAILAAPAALGRCAEPLGAYATAVAAAPDAVAADPGLSRRRREVAAHGVAVRRAIGRRPAPAPDTSDDGTTLHPAGGGTAPEGLPNQESPAGPEAPAGGPRSPEVTTAHAALDAISLQLDALTELFGPPPTAPAPTPAPAQAASG